MSRLDDRQNFDAALLNYLKELEKTKPVIICGDLNVAHKSIDLARPQANYNKSAGHMQEEMDGMDLSEEAKRQIIQDKLGIDYGYLENQDVQAGYGGDRFDKFDKMKMFMGIPQ